VEHPLLFWVWLNSLGFGSKSGIAVHFTERCKL